MNALLIKTDGYTIQTTTFADTDSARAAMTADYSASNKNAADSAEHEMSHISDTEALLYDRSDNVFVWKIVSLQPETNKQCACQQILQNITKELDGYYEDAHNPAYTENTRERYAQQYQALVEYHSREGYSIRRNSENKHVVSLKEIAPVSEETSYFDK